jgi:CRISPR-associated endonuclease/helicase Cas3
MGVVYNKIKTDVIAHIKFDEDSNTWCFQSNHEHLKGVAQLASEFAKEFNMSSWGYVIGMLHDKGKEQKSFQQHIKRESGYSPNTVVEGDSNHAYVGALIAKKLFADPPFYTLMDNVIMGHHRGLYDEDDKNKKMQAIIPNDVSVEDIKVKLATPNIEKKKDIHHIVRMLYSCLVDADYLDTEKFIYPEQNSLRETNCTIEQLLEKLEVYLSTLKESAADTKVNKIRNEVQNYCIEKSESNVDFYSLTVPTGGGKTLSSILWALKHAKKNGLRRVIIAIPYTSIITQTASVLRGIFGDENVLEHHSNIDFNDVSTNEKAYKMKLATENWNYPIVVTTNVQLFESLFSNRPSDCRKLHNIVNSVLILDEIQTLPMEFLQPIVDTLDTLKRVFNVSCLFTTASQPILNGTIRGTNYQIQFEALPNVREIIPYEAKLYDRLRRVKLEFDDKAQSYDEIAEKIANHDRVLCIVNTRKDAKEIYSRLPNNGICLHLSRMMCPAHIKKVIEKLKLSLKDNSQTVIRVVATQLIEAGVDIDFPVVFRQEAGLDSVLQAAGRCNREGFLDTSTTYIFALDKKLPSGFITHTNNARKNMIGDFDWFSPKAMEEYFRQLHSRIDCFDKPNVKSLLYEGNMYFETVSKEFRLIDDTTTSIIVNYGDDVEQLISQLKKEGYSYRLMKQLAQYSISVRDRDLFKLKQAGVVEEVYDNMLFVRDVNFYDDNIGLKTDNHWIEESIII